jgi:hypothetical protein
MTDDWDFYLLRVDGEPASIFVNLGIQADAPLQALPHMAYVRLYMNQARPDGLSSSEEFETLVAMEKSMEEILCGESVCYVGRNTSGGCRDFYFYVSSPADWPEQVARALSACGDYKYETGSREDADWSVYLNFLLPGPVDRQRIENRRVCESLERHGDPLVAEREIDHWSYFPDALAADAYLAEAEALGFHLRTRTVSDSGALRHGVQVWGVDVPSHQNIDDVTIPLFEAAVRHKGDYDGWECEVVD